MASQVFPKKNAAFTFYIGLVDQADTKLFKSSATLAAGDFKVSIDGAALNNLATLPSVNPAASKLVLVSLSAAEMNGDNIQVIFRRAQNLFVQYFLFLKLSHLPAADPKESV